VQKFTIYAPIFSSIPGRRARGWKHMTDGESEEILEAWTDLKAIYAEIEALHADSGTAFAAFAAQTAAAH